MPKFLLVLICSILLSLIFTPIVRFLAKKLKLRQTVLSYVDNHAGKSGTPTMGGIAFVIATVVTTLIFTRENSSLATLLVVLMVCFALVGFLDDFIKVFFRRNEGLSRCKK